MLDVINMHTAFPIFLYSVRKFQISILLMDISNYHNNFGNGNNKHNTIIITIIFKTTQIECFFLFLHFYFISKKGEFLNILRKKNFFFTFLNDTTGVVERLKVR